MSWSFSFVAKDKAAAVAELERQKDAFKIPEPAVRAVEAHVEMMPEGKPVIVEANGHVDSAWGNSKLDVRVLQQIVGVE